MKNQNDLISDLALFACLAVLFPFVIMDVIRQNWFKKPMKSCMKCVNNSCALPKKYKQYSYDNNKEYSK